jgi:hypothetical protein
LTFELLFLRGNGASIARIVPYAALHYMAYEEYRRWIILGFPNVEQGPVLDLVSGSIAGGTAVIFTYPLDLVRTKLAYQVGFTPCLRKITLLHCGSKRLLTTQQHALLKMIQPRPNLSILMLLFLSRII